MNRIKKKKVLGELKIDKLLLLYYFYYNYIISTIISTTADDDDDDSLQKLNNQHIITLPHSRYLGSTIKSCVRNDDLYDMFF